MSSVLNPQEETLLLVLKHFSGQIKGIKRLQKLIFLSQHNGIVADKAKFVFAPYLRGPFSMDCMDTLTELSQKGFVRIRRIPDDRFRGHHEVQLTEKGFTATESLRSTEESRVFFEQYRGIDTDGLTEASYAEFYRSIRPTMLYVNTPAIDEVTCYPSSPHWRSTIGEKIKLSVPIGRTAALEEKEAEKLERIRDLAAVFTSTRHILDDWKVRRLVPGCVIRTYGIFHDIRQASLGLVGKFSHSLRPARNNVIEALVDAFGKIFFLDDGAETLMTYVVELCGEVGVSLTHPVINALYILGYEALCISAEERSSKNVGNHDAKLGFRRADEIFNASSMFT